MGIPIGLAIGQKPERHGELMLESRGAGHLPALHRQPGSGSPPAAA
jgi:hypothetical protein